MNMEECKTELSNGATVYHAADKIEMRLAEDLKHLVIKVDSVVVEFAGELPFNDWSMM